MQLRSLTAFLASSLLCASAFGADTPLLFDFTKGGNAAERPAYDSARGFGFEAGTDWKFSVRVPEGNFRVTLTFKKSRKPTHARVLSEQRRVMVPVFAVEKGDFVVNVRNSDLVPLPANATGGTKVALKPREIGSPTWDDKLTLEITGEAKLLTMSIVPVEVPTLFLAGDSTVTDQGVAPNASWGQFLPSYFKADMAVANHAESGETLKSFVSEMRLEKLLSLLKAGDWVMIQFGHNDQKVQWPQTYAEAATTYRSWLHTYIAEIRRRGVTPILVTSPERRNFDAAGRIIPSLGEYPEAVRAVAREERVALIDLTPRSVQYYETLGPDAAQRAFADEGRDKTHHSEIGASALAGFVVDGLRAADRSLTAGLERHLYEESIQ